jgi:hypothetical protein
MEEYGMDCVSCHDGVDRMRDFDHNQVYALQGGHAEADCQECHAEQVFAGTAQDCVACHADPELHAGKFGSDCARCHTAVAWQPAKLTRHAFQLTHVSTEQLECQTCHLEDFTEQTCYNCHDHQPADMAVVHQAEGIQEYENCSHCHPSGQAGEAAMLLEKYGAFDLIPPMYKPVAGGVPGSLPAIMGTSEALDRVQLKDMYMKQLQAAGNTQPGTQPEQNPVSQGK